MTKAFKVEATLRSEISAELHTQLSAEELHAALQKIRNGKAPGIDGLPAAFYKFYKFSGL